MTEFFYCSFPDITSYLKAVKVTLKISYFKKKNLVNSGKLRRTLYALAGTCYEVILGTQAIGSELI